MTLGSEMYAIRDLFLACPPVYTLPGTWNDPEKIAKCNETLIPHFTFNPDLLYDLDCSDHSITGWLWSIQRYSLQTRIGRSLG